MSAGGGPYSVHPDWADPFGIPGQTAIPRALIQDHRLNTSELGIAGYVLSFQADPPLPDAGRVSAHAALSPEPVTVDEAQAALDKLVALGYLVRGEQR